VTSVGIDAMTVHEVERRRKGPITKWNYLSGVLHALARYSPPSLSVTVDGEPLEGEFGLVLISNTVGYGGVLHLAEEARIDDGLFEIYLFPTGKIVELAGAFVRGVLSHLPGGAVTMLRGRRMRIESEQPVPYQVDGGRGGMTPVEVEVSTRQYRIVVP
jgi:diacylglycerol kinase (ATP)